MATTETTETTETLRAAIEAALRRRDRRGMAALLACDDDDVDESIRATTARINDDALRALALACGLRVETCGACNGRGRHDYAREVEDGCDACECAGVVVVDPAEEVERLTRALHDVAERLGCADYDDVVAAVSDALDDAEKREREHVDEANALRMERDRLTRERDEARAALRACARRCEHRCGEIATIRAGDETQQGGAFRYCDNPECRGGEPVLGDVPHAAALRAAGGGR